MEEIERIIFNIINKFHDSIPTADRLHELSQIREPNQPPDDEPPIEYEEFEQIVNDIREIVTRFNGNTKDQIGVLLTQMNDVQQNYYKEKAESAHYGFILMDDFIE